MSRISIFGFTIIAAAAVIFSMSAATAVANGRPAARFTPYLTSVSFADPSDGWVSAGQRGSQGTVGSHSYLYRTRNAGKSWHRATLNWIATQMQFISGSRGWAIVQSPANCNVPNCSWAIVATANGGSNWSIQLNGGRCWQIESLDFISSQEGWAIESSAPCHPGNHLLKTRLVETTNGGQTWTVVFKPAWRLTSVHFGQPQVGWATADGLTGGNSAHCKTVLYNKNDMSQSFNSQLQVSGYCDAFVDFVDPLHGWILATNVGACAMGGCYDNRLYQTTDGGTSWTMEKKRWFPAGCGFLQQPHFVTPNVGYIAISRGAGSCSKGGIAITRDGGHTWSVKAPDGHQISDVSPVSAANVWAIGCSSNGPDCTNLVHTTNTGHGWSARSLK